MLTENTGLAQLKRDIIQSAQRGYPLFLAGALYWSVMAALGLYLETERLSLIYILAMCMVFPLGVAIGSVLKVNFITRNNPLGTLGGILAGVQMCYLPVYIIIYQTTPTWVPVVIGLLGGSHFLPYAWVYNSKAYYFQTGAMVVVSLLFTASTFTLLPLAMAAVYLITTALLIWENRRS